MLHELSTIISEMNNSEEVEEFLRQLLTPPEQTMIERRWELVKLLHKGVPQREIAGRLGMSLCKVTRGAKELKKEESVFRRILERRTKPEKN